MGNQIIKQPNGLYCVFSSVVDNVILYNAKPEDILQMWVKDYEEDTRRHLDKIIRKLDEGGKPYYQFTKTYDDMLDCIETVHSKKMKDKVKNSIENGEECDW